MRSLNHCTYEKRRTRAGPTERYSFRPRIYDCRQYTKVKVIINQQCQSVREFLKEQRERFSRLASCREGCFDSRRRVNSTVHNECVPLSAPRDSESAIFLRS